MIRWGTQASSITLDNALKNKEAVVVDTKKSVLLTAPGYYELTSDGYVHRPGMQRPDTMPLQAIKIRDYIPYEYVNRSRPITSFKSQTFSGYGLILSNVTRPWPLYGDVYIDTNGDIYNAIHNYSVNSPSYQGSGDGDERVECNNRVTHGNRNQYVDVTLGALGGILAKYAFDKLTHEEEDDLDVEI